MYRRNDPRLQRTLNQISQNLEIANESAQENLFTFSQNYVNPCLSSIGGCWNGCIASCFPTRDDRLRRNRAQSRGRAELSFDFYDDWEEEENDSLLGWGNDGLDRILGSGGYGTTAQPSRERGMSFGRKGQAGAKRRSGAHAHEGQDPRVIPSSSYFGFFGKLPFNLGGKSLRYKPSAADLTEHPGAMHRHEHEAEPLIEESEDEAAYRHRTHGRKRSETNGSGHTTDSLSSRGDIFPSEDELDDAVPLDDEFAMALERRTTGLSTDEASSGKARGKRPSGSRVSMRTESSRSTRGSKRRARGSSHSAVEEVLVVPTLSDLKAEEVLVQQEEEADIARKRDAAQKLAAERGLAADISQLQSSMVEQPQADRHGGEPEVKAAIQFSPDARPPAETFPFPAFETIENDAYEHPDGTDDVPVDHAAPKSGNAEPSQSELRAPVQQSNASFDFVPAKLPHFDNGPS